MGSPSLHNTVKIHPESLNPTRLHGWGEKLVAFSFSLQPKGQVVQMLSRTEVYVDGVLAGACFPFPVLYTGETMGGGCCLLLRLRSLSEPSASRLLATLLTHNRGAQSRDIVSHMDKLTDACSESVLTSQFLMASFRTPRVTGRSSS